MRFFKDIVIDRNRILFYPYFGVWLYVGRWNVRFTIRIRSFYRHFYFGTDRNRIQ